MRTYHSRRRSYEEEEEEERWLVADRWGQIIRIAGEVFFLFFWRGWGGVLSDWLMGERVCLRGEEAGKKGYVWMEAGAFCVTVCGLCSLFSVLCVCVCVWQCGEVGDKRIRTHDLYINKEVCDKPLQLLYFCIFVSFLHYFYIIYIHFFWTWYL